MGRGNVSREEGEKVRAIARIRLGLGNPLVRAFLSVGVRGRGKSLLESSLEHLAYGCGCGFGCRFYSLVVGLLIRFSARGFGGSYGEVVRYLRDPFFRRGVVNVLESIAMFGIRTPQVMAAPIFVVWQFTNRCNLRCRHCYASSTPSSMPDELTTDEAKKLIDELAECGVAGIAFSGGEPLARGDFFEVARYAKERGFYVSVATNGTLITPSVAKMLKDCVDYVEISIDGLGETHDSFRGVPGAFDRAVEGAKNCIAQGIDVGIAMTVTRYNLSEVPKVIQLAKDIGASRFCAFNFIPTGRGRDIIDVDLAPDEREELLKFLYTKMLEDNSIQILSTAPQYSRISIQAVKENPNAFAIPTHFFSKDIGKALKSKTEIITEFIGGCGAGRLYCAIQPNGDVWPCVFMPIRVGNIRERRFRDIWLNNKILNALRDRSKLKGHCGVCKYRNVCGGCRARAYAYFGDILAPDPGCINNKNFYLQLHSQSKW